MITETIKSHFHKIMLISICMMSLGLNISFTQNTLITELPSDWGSWQAEGDVQVDNNEYILSEAVNDQASFMYYDKPYNLNECGKWKVEFDFKLWATGNGSGGDGISFSFLDNSPNGIGSGAEIGLPTNSLGLKIVFDTYYNQNDSPRDSYVNVKYGEGYSDNPPTGLNKHIHITDFMGFPMGGFGLHLRKDQYQNAVIEFDSGHLTITIEGVVILDDDITPTDGAENITSGYFGFSASTGAFFDEQRIKNVKVYVESLEAANYDVLDPICAEEEIDLTTYNNDLSNQGDNFYFYEDENVALTDENHQNNITDPQHFSNLTIGQNTIYVRVEDQDLDCPNIVELTFEVFESPDKPTFIVTDPTCDDNGIAQIENFDDATYDYTISPTTASIDGSGEITGTPGEYTVTITNNKGCTAQNQVVIATHSEITSTDTQTACDSFTWIDGVTYTVSNNSATHTLTATNGCDSIITLNLTINTSPVIDNISTTDASCNSTNGTITVTVSGGAPSLNYSLDNGQTSTTGEFTGLASGDYEVTVEENNGCSSTQTVTVGNSGGPILTLVSSTDASCFGESDGSAEVSATGGSSSYTYNWSPTGGSDAIATGLGAGVYTVTVDDGSGCTDQKQITISEPDEIIVNETITSAECEKDNGSIALTVTGGTGNYSYVWSPNVGTTDIVEDLPVGDYEVTVTDQEGCSKTISYSVPHGNSFYIEVIPNNITISQGEDVDLHLFVDPNVIVDNINWTPASGLSCTDCKNPLATPEVTTTYIVTVTDENGCTAVDTAKINVVLPCPEVFVPNTFSPNEDGLNDFQCVLGGCILSLEFTIFNRWGEPIFQTIDQNECWNGRYRGQLVQSGTYVYKLKATLKDGSTVDKTGSLNVVR